MTEQITQLNIDDIPDLDPTTPAVSIAGLDFDPAPTAWKCICLDCAPRWTAAFPLPCYIESRDAVMHCVRGERPVWFQARRRAV